MPYNTVSEADGYFSARYGFDKWESLTESQKLAALTSASQKLDLLCHWNGYKTDPDQEAQFPRNGETEPPQEVKTSELEIAYLIIDTGSTATESDDSVTMLKAGSVQLEFNSTGKEGNPLINGTVETLLSPLGECSFNMGGGSTLSIPIYR